MKTFFLNIISSFIGVFLAWLLISFMIISFVVGTIYSFIQAFEDDSGITKLAPQSVLILRLDYPIPERTSDDPFDHYDFETLESRVVLGLDDIVESIYTSITDTNIEGIYLNISSVNQGWAKSSALRQALLDFKNSGKWIVSYNEYYSHNSYYISSVADEIYLNPEGQIQFQGLNFQSLFLKGTLEKLGVAMQVLRGPDNKYKSAIETFTEEGMSDDNRFQTDVMVNNFWTHIIQSIADSRNITPDALNKIANQLALRLPEDSLHHKLVDGLLYQDQVRNIIKKKVEGQSGEVMMTISIEDYNVQTQPIKVLDELYSDNNQNQIAIIYADGAIQSGANDDGIIGSITTSYAIRSARENENVKSMVLRINSPGGSALASDVILREAYLFSQEKPLIVSFGDVAASGGYYIASAAHKIFAQHNTVTGSIGVFGLLPNLENLLEDKIGLRFDKASSNDYADFGTTTRPLKDLEKQHLQQQIEHVYLTFKQHVAKGRSMRLEDVENIAQGRVWSGTQAKNVGLVDEFGGLNDAIKAAADSANINNYTLLKLPIQKTTFSRFVSKGNELAQTWLARSVLGKSLVKQVSPWIDHFQEIKALSIEKTVQARMPFSFTLE